MTGIQVVPVFYFNKKVMSEKTRNSILLQGSILALAGLISKIIGFIYRIPMANIMGSDGNSLYSVAFGIYNIALTLSSYSMPLAVSKLMSARLAKKQYKDAHRLFLRALLFAAVAGFIACVVLYAGADVIAYLYKREGVERPLRILAPTVFIVALLGTCRGYFQGHKTMVPTAVSQVIEQIINAIVSVAASYGFMKACMVESEKSSYAAMGGTLGTLAGAFSALLIFVGLFFINRKTRKEELSQEDISTEDNLLIFKSILLTVIPVVISQTIYQFGYTLDDLLYGNIMFFKGIDKSVARSLQGVFNTQYNQMINLPVAIATSMASATLPSIVSSFTVGEHGRVKEKMSMVLKINMLIAIPSFVGLAVLADPIMSVLFPGLKEYHNTAVILLETGSLAVVFYALSTLSTSILQGCDHMKVPVIHSGISLVAHGIIVASLLFFTDLNVYALVIGNVTFPMLVCILNIRSIKKLIGYKMDYMHVFVLPLVSALVMGLLAKLSYMGVLAVLNSEGRMMKCISLCASIFIAGVTYFVSLVITKAVTREELKNMPVIKKIIK